MSRKSTGSAAFDAMIDAGFRFSEDATVSAKDELLSISRVKIGRSLSPEDAVSNDAIVQAVAASEGGQVAINGVNDKVDGLRGAFGINVLLGLPMSTEGLKRCATRQKRDALQELVAGRNRQQDALAEDLALEIAALQADDVFEDSHVGEDAAQA